VLVGEEEGVQLGRHARHLFQVGVVAERARPRNRNLHQTSQAARAGAQHGDPVGQQDRFLDGVGHEDDRRAEVHVDALEDSFRRPSERFYLYYFLRGRLGFPIYGALLSQTREVRQQAVSSLSQHIFREMAERKKQGQFGLAFVIFPTPGNRFDEGALSLLRGAGIPVVDLQGCLRGRLDTELYAELHPTSLGNEMLAACLVRDLAAKGLLPSVPKAG